MLLNNLVQSMKQGVTQAAGKNTAQIQPATPTAQGLGKLMMEMKNQMPQPTSPQPVNIGRPNARQGVKQIFKNPEGLRAKTPQMSSEMRQTMTGT